MSFPGFVGVRLGSTSFATWTLDGATWFPPTSITGDFTTNSYTVAYSPQLDLFVALFYNSPRVATSSDGNNWTITGGHPIGGWLGWAFGQWLTQLLLSR